MPVTCPACGGGVKRDAVGLTAECEVCHQKYKVNITASSCRSEPPLPVESYNVADETKACPYCGETIKKVAVKCRHCGTMLTGHLPMPIVHPPRQNPLSDRHVGESIIYDESPSQWLNIATFIGFGIMALLGIICLFLPIKDVPSGWIGLGIIIAAVTGGFCAYVNVRFTKYHVTTERIEVEKGWLSKQIDNMDLFRMKDVRVSQGIFDRLMRIGTVTVVSRDSTDPILKLVGISEPRELYDRLKKEAIEADKRRGVVHVES